MKLVDMLVREFKQWPAGEDAIAGPTMANCGVATAMYNHYGVKLPDTPEIVTRQQWQAAVDALEAVKTDTGVDWRRAPRDATHYNPASQGFIKIVGADLFLWLDRSPHDFGFWGSHNEYFADRVIDRSKLIARPLSSVWGGEGLPPVGLVCELWFSDGDWQPCRVMAHDLTGSVPIAVVRYGEQVYTGSSSKTLRPLRAAEQIKADERKAGIKAMIADFSWIEGSCTHCLPNDTATRLYDIGYRKQTK